MKTNINKIERLGIAGEDYRGLFLSQREQHEGDRAATNNIEGELASFEGADKQARRQRSLRADQRAAKNRQNAAAQAPSSAQGQSKQRDRSENSKTVDNKKQEQDKEESSLIMIGNKVSTQAKSKGDRQRAPKPKRGFKIDVDGL